MAVNSIIFWNETDAGLFKIALEEKAASFVIERVFLGNKPSVAGAKFTVDADPAFFLQQGWELARMVDFIKLKITSNDSFFSGQLEEYANDFQELFSTLETEMH